MQLTKKQFTETVTAISGATFMTLDLNTEPKMVKTGNPFIGRVRKLSTTNVTVGASYENSVNRQSGREGNKADFEAKSLPWGEWLVPNKLIAHKGEIYLRAHVNAHMVPDVKYTVDGELASPSQMAEIEPFLRERKPSARQAEHGNEKEVKPFTVNIGNIRQVKTGGTTYAIV